MSDVGYNPAEPVLPIVANIAPKQGSTFATNSSGTLSSSSRKLSMCHTALRVFTVANCKCWPLMQTTFRFYPYVFSTGRERVIVKGIHPEKLSLMVPIAADGKMHLFVEGVTHLDERQCCATRNRSLVILGAPPAAGLCRSRGRRVPGRRTTESSSAWHERLSKVITRGGWPGAEC